MFYLLIEQPELAAVFLASLCLACITTLFFFR